MSTAYATPVSSPDNPEDVQIRLNRYGSRATRNKRTMLRVRVPVVSMCRTDVVSVYRNQIPMRIRKLNPKNPILEIKPWLFAGLLLSKPSAPMESARPKIRSVRDYILGRGRFGSWDIFAPLSHDKIGGGLVLKRSSD
jgi:hypothetical protein